MRFAFRPAVPKPRPADRHVRLPAQLDDGPLGHLRGQRSAVPALAIFDLGEREGLRVRARITVGRSASAAWANALSISLGGTTLTRC